MKRLRRKLGDAAADPRHIITEPRVGYRMAVGETGARRLREIDEPHGPGHARPAHSLQSTRLGKIKDLPVEVQVGPVDRRVAHVG